MSDSHIIFVYGSLLKGLYGHDEYMQDAEFLSNAEVTGDLRFYTPEYPVLILKKRGKTVKGQLYRINNDTLNRIREYEGLNDTFTWYHEAKIQIGEKEVIIFTVKPSLSIPILFISEHIPHGDWISFSETSRKSPFPQSFLIALLIIFIAIMGLIY